MLLNGLCNQLTAKAMKGWMTYKKTCTHRTLNLSYTLTMNNIEQPLSFKNLNPLIVGAFTREVSIFLGFSVGMSPIFGSTKYSN
jgi:hypothetical protein